MKPFADNAEYLQAACGRIRTLIERALAVAEGRAEEAARLAETAKKQQAEMAARAGDGIGLPMLQKRLGLDDADADVLMHAAATQLDPALGKLHTKLSGTAFHPWLDVGLAVQVQHDGVAERLRARARFEPTAPLVKHRLIALDRARPEAKDNVNACELKLPPRVARVILGADPTGGAATYARLVTPDVELDSVVLPDDARAELEQLLAAQPGLGARLAEWGYDALLPSGRAVVVLFTGAPGTGKTMLATALARRLGKKLLVIDGPRLAEAGRALETELDELFVEARLADAVVLFDGCEVLFGGRGGPRSAALMRALDRFDGLVILDDGDAGAARSDARSSRHAAAAARGADRRDAREDLARAALADGAAGRRRRRQRSWPSATNCRAAQIRSAVLYAVSKAVARGASSTLTRADLDAAAQAQLRGDSDGVGRAHARHQAHARRAGAPVRGEIADRGDHLRRPQPRQGAAHLGLQREAADGQRARGALVGRARHRQDAGRRGHRRRARPQPLSRQPGEGGSKFVGETEKNLNEILAQAKSTHAILFFDEADALFSSRVAKVETANDRFVNMETNFLLQQLERYEGIVILATNLETSIDQAFKRRIAYHIVVPFPKPVDRERIWRTLMPSRAPVGKIDYARLGKTFDLSGGHIKNAILRAAYIAAQRDRRSITTC